VATATIIRLCDTARVSLPGALDGQIRMSLFAAIKEFTQRSNVWQDVIGITVNPNVWDYAVAAEANALINRLLWLEGIRSTNNLTQVGSGSSRAGQLTLPGSLRVGLRILSPPSTSELWYAHVAYTIADPTNAEGLPTIPDWIIDKYSDALLSGVLSRMMSAPSKPYSNLKLASYHQGQFRKGMNLARAEVSNGNVFDQNSWRYPRTFRMRSQRY